MHVNASPELPDIHHRVLKELKNEIKAQAKILSSQTAAVAEDWSGTDVTHKYEVKSGGTP